MSQPQNNVTTLLIPDPNGGQPQMIKVMAGNKIPFQVANASGSGASTSTIKTFIKANTGDQTGGTIIQTNKFGNRQLIALPTKPGVTLQGIRGNMVQLKSARPGDNVQYSTRVIQSTATPTMISSPMVIRTQTGALTAVSNSNSTPIQISHLNYNKPIQQQQQQQTLVSAPILSAQLKQPGAANRQMFTLKTQTMAGQKQHELILLSSQPKSRHEIVQQPQQPQAAAPPKPPTPVISPPVQPQVISPPKSLMNTSILDHSGSRKRHDFDFDYSVESKRRKTEKGGKGLRHFSMKVCEKVQAKGTTSYNEVADELVNEFSESQRANSPAEGANYDQKNIRRRVYDALNVLMAMNIISKEKKEIHWLGLPTNSLQECHKLEQERKKRLQKIKVKTQQLQDLILQQIAFKNLVERNRKMEEEHGAPSPNSAIQLPFIIVNTNKKTVIECSINSNKSEYFFKFDDTFEIHDDIEVLKRRGMALGLDKGMCTEEDLEKAKSLVPPALASYVTELAQCPPEPKVNPLEDPVGGLEEGEMGDLSLEKLIPRDQRMDSRSSSSFGDYEDGLEESDVEV